ncbi:MAG: Spy/CpxP family protein refolding chaperone [Deltaproteobacteria bacterium]
MKRLLILPILLFLIFSASANAGHHWHKDGHWWNDEATVKKLELTDEQTSQIKEIEATYSPALDKAAETFKENKTAFKKVMSDPASSKADVIKAFDVMWDSKYKMKRVMLDMKLDVKTVLTPEQITKLVEMKQKHKEEMKKKWDNKKKQ